MAVTRWIQIVHALNGQDQDLECRYLIGWEPHLYNNLTSFLPFSATPIQFISMVPLSQADGRFDQNRFSFYHWSRWIWEHNLLIDLKLNRPETCWPTLEFIRLNWSIHEPENIQLYTFVFVSMHGFPALLIPSKPERNITFRDLLFLRTSQCWISLAW